MLWPDATLAGGGTLVTIIGEGFGVFDAALQTTKCRFGSATVAARSKNATAVVCEAPPVAEALPDDAASDGGGGGAPAPPAPAVLGAAGSASVYLTLNDQDYELVGEVLYFHFTLDEVRPSGGPSGGGTLLTLRGSGFDGVYPRSSMGAPLARARCRFRYRHPEDAGVRRIGQSAAGFLGGGRDGLAAPFPDEWVRETPVLSRSAHELRCLTPSAPPNFTGAVAVQLTLNDLNFLPGGTDGGGADATATAAALVHLLLAAPTDALAARRARARRHDGRHHGERPGCVRLARADPVPLWRRRAHRAGERARQHLRGVHRAVGVPPARHHGHGLRGGYRHLPPSQRTHVRIGELDVPLSPTPANASAWRPTEVAVTLNGEDFSRGADARPPPPGPALRLLSAAHAHGARAARRADRRPVGCGGGGGAVAFRRRRPRLGLRCAEATAATHAARGGGRRRAHVVRG